MYNRKRIVENGKVHNYPVEGWAWVWLGGMALTLAYSTFHELFQLKQEKHLYFLDSWNYSDLSYCVLGWYNIIQQAMGETWTLSAKVVSILVVMLCLIKTMFFFRVIMSYSYIVTMLI